MAQMSVQITTPYGTIRHVFSEDERDVVTTIDGGTTLVTYDLMSRLLGQAEQATHQLQGDTLLGFDDSDEHDFTVAIVRTVLGRRVLDVLPISAQDPAFYEVADAEFSEVDGYELSALPFEVTVTDTTGQLYDEHKEGVQA